MYKFFVGIDVSKDVIDSAIMINGQKQYLGQFTNDHNGFKHMLGAISQHIDGNLKDGFMCFENTGVYSKALLEYLVSQQIPCREENPIQIKKSLGIKRGKTDQVDAIAICQYAFEKRDSIQASKLDKPLMVKLKALLSTRELYVKQKVALLTRFNEMSLTMDEELKANLGQQSADLVQMYEDKIAQLEQQIKELMKQDDEMNKNNELIQSIKGIGPIIAANMIACTNNFVNFDNARQFACYCGIAPFSNQSGTYRGRDKVNHMANKKIKSLLSNAIVAAITHDPQIRRYKETKLNQGKAKQVVYNNIKNKLVQRVFAVIKRQTPYVVLP